MVGLRRNSVLCDSILLASNILTKYRVNKQENKFYYWVNWKWTESLRVTLCKTVVMGKDVLVPLPANGSNIIYSVGNSSVLFLNLANKT
jgi:hypothetical protein